MSEFIFESKTVDLFPKLQFFHLNDDKVKGHTARFLTHIRGSEAGNV